MDQLARGESTVGQLAAPFAVSLPAISRHVRVLEQSGLLRRRVSGRVHHCSLVPERLRLAQQWLDRYRAFWDQQLDSLADLLQSD